MCSGKQEASGVCVKPGRGGRGKRKKGSGSPKMRGSVCPENGGCGGALFTGHITVYCRVSVMS